MASVLGLSVEAANASSFLGFRCCFRGHLLSRFRGHFDSYDAGASQSKKCCLDMGIRRQHLYQTADFSRFRNTGLPKADTRRLFLFLFARYKSKACIGALAPKTSITHHPNFTKLAVSERT